MALKYWAYIYLSPDFEENANTVETSSPLCRFKSVGVDFNQKEKVIPISKKLVEEGVQLIELCGGFGPTWIAKVSEATNGAVPVGGVMYGPEARKPLLEITNATRSS